MAPKMATRLIVQRRFAQAAQAPTASRASDQTIPKSQSGMATGGRPPVAANEGSESDLAHTSRSPQSEPIQKPKLTRSREARAAVIASFSYSHGRYLEAT